MDYLAKVFSWVKSEAEETFSYLKAMINCSMNDFKRFSDNIAESLKQSLAVARKKIKKIMSKILELLLSLKNWVCSSTLDKMEWSLTSLINRLVEKMKILASEIRTFQRDTKEAENETRGRYKSSFDSKDGEKFGSFKNLMLEFVKVLVIIVRKSGLLPKILNIVYSVRMMELDLKKVDECFKMMGFDEDDRKVAIFLYVFVKDVRPLLS